MNKLLLAFGLTLLVPFMVRAESGGQLLITELSTGDETSASSEFVEIYNQSDGSVDLSEYSIEYLSASGDKWQKKAGLDGELAARSRYLVASTKFNGEASTKMSSGLAASGGHLRIVKGEAVSDYVSWGLAEKPEIEPASVHEKTQSLKRLVDEDGLYLDSNNNEADFFVSEYPTPTFNRHYSDTPATTSKPRFASQNVVPAPKVLGVSAEKDFAQISISELFPDPKSPQTDKEDEFVELYNHGEETVRLGGYKLQSGKDWRYEYEFDSEVIAPGAYIALYSADSGLTLSNGGSQVRVVSPAGKVVDGLAYDKAKTGQSLIKNGEEWSWTQNITPGERNAITGEQNEGAGTGEADKVAIVGVGSEENSNSEDKQGIEEQDEKTLDTSVLVLVGSLVVIYGLYEYRHDIFNIIQKTRRYFESRREHRREAKGRRNNRIDWRRWFGQNSFRSWARKRSEE